jgi:hypothetical protein
MSCQRYVVTKPKVSYRVDLPQLYFNIFWQLHQTDLDSPRRGPAQSNKSVAQWFTVLSRVLGCLSGCPWWLWVLDGGLVLAAWARSLQRIIDLCQEEVTGVIDRKLLSSAGICYIPCWLLKAGLG